MNYQQLILDSNVFIQAYRYHYPMDIFPSFWNKLIELAYEGFIVSIDKVKKELYKYDDNLKIWCDNNLPPNFFASTYNEEVIKEYKKLAEWAAHKNDRYTQKAIRDFLDSDNADAFLIAYVAVAPKNRILVTQEVSSPNSKRTIKIPDVCKEFGLRCINLVEMLRLLGISI